MEPKDFTKVQQLADTLLKIAKSDKDRKEFAENMDKAPLEYFAKLIEFAPSHQKVLKGKKHSDVKNAASFTASVVLAFQPETLKELETITANCSTKVLNPLITVANIIILWTTSSQEEPQTEDYFDDAKNKVMACAWAKIDLGIAIADLVEAQLKFMECLENQVPVFPYPIPSACQGDLMNLNAAFHNYEVANSNHERLCDVNPIF